MAKYLFRLIDYMNSFIIILYINHSTCKVFKDSFLPLSLSFLIFNYFIAGIFLLCNVSQVVHCC